MLGFEVDLEARYETLREIIDNRIHIPAGDRATSIRPGEAVFINALLSHYQLTRTLEIGFAYGYSAAYILDATKAHHVVIDPNQDEYSYLGPANIGTLGWSSKLEHRPHPSHKALPELLNEGRRFQFVFIDGGHKFDDIFVDWFYSDLLLEVDGFVLFHDAWMRSTQIVAEFVRTNRRGYRECATPVSNLILFRKTSVEDTRPWYDFEEFYTTESIDIYQAIRQQIEGTSSSSDPTCR